MMWTYENDNCIGQKVVMALALYATLCQAQGKAIYVVYLSFDLSDLCMGLMEVASGPRVTRGLPIE